MRPLPDETEIEIKPERSIGMTLVCLWWFLVTPFSVLLAFARMPRADLPGSDFETTLTLNILRTEITMYIVMIIVAVIGMAGVWRLRRWGAVTFLITAFLGVGLLLSNGPNIGIVSWLISAVVVLINLKHMS